MLTSSQWSFAMGINYLSAGEYEYNGETIDNSDYNLFTMIPSVGYQMALGSTKVNIMGSYPLSVSGKNVSKGKIFAIGAAIYF